MSILFADTGCPYAHRVRAFLTHLRVPHDVELAQAGDPSPRQALAHGLGVPMLEHEGLRLTESRVILEYLAERYGYAPAFPEDFQERSTHRYAMALVDQNLAPGLFIPHEPRELVRLGRSLDVFEATMSSLESPSLFVFQIAPLWRHLRIVRPQSRAIGLVEGRPALCDWLDAATKLPCIASTALASEELRAEVGRALGAAAM